MDESELSVFAVSMTIDMGVVFPPPIEMDSRDEIEIEAEEHNNNLIKSNSTKYSISADFIRRILLNQSQYNTDFQLIKYSMKNSETLFGTCQRPDEILVSLNNLAQNYKSIDEFVPPEIGISEMEKCLKITMKKYETRRVYWFLDVQSFLKCKVFSFQSISTDFLEVFVFGDLPVFHKNDRFVRNVLSEFQKNEEKMKIHLIMCNRDILEIRENLKFDQIEKVKMTGNLHIGQINCAIKVDGQTTSSNYKYDSIEINLIGFIEKLENWIFEEEKDIVVSSKSEVFVQLKEYLKEGNCGAFCQCFYGKQQMEYCLLIVVGVNEEIRFIRLNEKNEEKWREFLNMETVGSINETCEISEKPKQLQIYQPIAPLHKKSTKKFAKAAIQEGGEKLEEFVGEYEILGFKNEMQNYIEEIRSTDVNVASED